MLLPSLDNEEISQIEAESVEKVTENDSEAFNKSSEEDVESAALEQQHHNAEEEKLAKEFAATSANNEAAIKIQTAFRNRLAQKEGERRDAQRMAEAAPAEPPAERPLSSYRP